MVDSGCHAGLRHKGLLEGEHLGAKDYDVTLGEHADMTGDAAYLSLPCHDEVSSPRQTGYPIWRRVHGRPSPGSGGLANYKLGVGERHGFGLLSLRRGVAFCHLRTMPHIRGLDDPLGRFRVRVTRRHRSAAAKRDADHSSTRRRSV